MIYRVGPEWPRKTPATPPPTPYSLFLNGIEQRSSRHAEWYPATRRIHDVTALRKKWPDSVIWLVSVATTFNFRSLVSRDRGGEDDASSPGGVPMVA